jgi:2-polyprenyl-3-methyl-5-hydroxy-6-metoxy-1,4-benzoquinol methylase
MLKDAAMLTLHITKIALEYGMVLKDATPFNIQFYKGKPVFIDTLSFEKYNQRKPWVAYRQFCEMFLFPLYFEHYLKTDINKVLSTYMDGIPVELTSKLLPLKSSFNMGVWLHVHLQNTVKKKSKNDLVNTNFDKIKFQHLLNHLESSIHAFKNRKGTESSWSNYYQDTILSREYLDAKEKVFRGFIKGLTWKRALDLGANDGYFSNILAEITDDVVAIDFDSQCINQLYLQVKKRNITNILPLAVDLSNPSPAIGFNNSERLPFMKRAPSDMVTALALIHHLIFSKNITLSLLADFFRQLSTRYLVIEFIPVEDEKVKKLMMNKSEIRKPYDKTSFEAAFNRYFEIEKMQEIPFSSRILYLMRRK